MFGILAGMMPIMPFQTALSVGLALLFKGSKITAALGTWISNPLNWYFLYYFSYKLGAFLLGLQGHHAMFSSIMTAVRAGEDAMVIVEKMVSAGGVMLTAFFVGGLVMGAAASVPSYFIFLFIFNRIQLWRKSRKGRRNCRSLDQ